MRNKYLDPVYKRLLDADLLSITSIIACIYSIPFTRMAACGLNLVSLSKNKKKIKKAALESGSL